MTTPHKPAEHIGMRDVVKQPQEGDQRTIPASKLLEEIANAKFLGRISLEPEHPALTALKRLAGEFRRDGDDAHFRAKRLQSCPEKQILGDDYYMTKREANIFKHCAARLEQAIKEVEG